MTKFVQKFSSFLFSGAAPLFFLFIKCTPGMSFSFLRSCTYFSKFFFFLKCTPGMRFYFLTCCTYFLKFFFPQVHAWYEVWSERLVVVKAPRAAERESDGRCRLHLLYTLPAPHNHSLYNHARAHTLHPIVQYTLQQCLAHHTP